MTEFTDGTVGPAGHPTGLSLSGETKAAGGADKGATETDLAVSRQSKGKRKQDRDVTLGWGGGKLGKPVLAGTTATYKNVKPGVDVVVDARRSGYETHLVINTPAALATLVNAAKGSPVSWDIPVKTKGLTARSEQDGSVSFVDADGQVASRIATPIAWDAAVDPKTGNRVNESPVAMSVAQKGTGKATLTLTPDQNWLTSPDRVFPLTIDPTYASGPVIGPSFDTYVSSAFPSATYSTSTELRVGTYNGGGDKYRSFLTFPIISSGLAGKDVVSAYLSLYEFHSYSCTAKPFYVYSALGATSATNWTNQPGPGSQYGSLSTAKGYSSSCAAGRVSVPITSMIQYWAGSGSSAGGMRLSASETDTYGWKKFYADDSTQDPYISYTYNRKPNAGSAPTITGGVSYTPPGGTQAIYTSDTTPELSTVATDPDGSDYRSNIEVHTSTTTSSSTLKVSCTTRNPNPPAYSASGAAWKCTTPSSSALTNNTPYYVRAAIVDDRGLWNGTWSPWTTMRVGSSVPPAPSMSCPAPYQDSSWSGTIPAAISCSVTAVGTSWSAPSTVLVYDNGTLAATVAVTPSSVAATSTATFTYKPTKGGHHLTLTARNPAGVTSTVQGTYDLGFGDATMQVPADKTVTNGVVNVVGTLKAPTTSGTLQAHLQYRLPKDVGQSTGWVNDATPLTTTTMAGTVSASGTWNLGAVTATQLPGVSAVQSTVFQARICVHTTTNPTCLAWTNPNTITRPIFGAGGVSDGAGGAGTVDLASGIFSTGTVDVSVPGLTLGRTYDTLDPTATADDTSKGVFGPGWSSSLAGGPDGLTAWTIEDHVTSQGHFLMTPPDHSVTYAFGYPGGASGRYFAAGGSTNTAFTPNSGDAVEGGGTLVMQRASGTSTTATLTYTDGQGTKTSWTGSVASDGSAATSGSWVPDQVTDPDPGTASLHAYPAVGQVGKVGTLIASPAGVTCGTGTWSSAQRGCSRLDIAYATTTTATSTAPGDYTGQVKSITTRVWDRTAGAFISATTVASYQYDSLGQLVAVTDSRTALTTRYAYSGPGRISAITEPGRAPYRLWYDGGGRVTSVSRDDASAGSWSSSNSATLPAGSSYLARYAVGVSPAGDGSALPDLSPTGVAPWFQNADATGNPTGPSYGFAVFGANYPTGWALPTTATDPKWHYARLSFTAGDYTVVNTAQFGAGRWLLTATDYNADGSVARTLDETAIAEVRAAVSAGTPLSRGQVDDISTQTVYVPETVATADVTLGSRLIRAGDVIIPGGTEVSDTYGPLHDAVVAGGVEQGVRTHTHSTYDGSGAPNGGLNPDTGMAYGLVTEQRTYARSAGNSDPSQNADLSTLTWIVNGYAALPGDTVNGWRLGMPTTVTTKDGAGVASDVTRTMRYDDAGRILEVRQPGASGSNDAGTRLTTYYTASGTGPCQGTPEWAEQVCTTGPAAGTLPVTSFTYEMWGGVATATEKVGSTTLRTKSTTYDSAGRLTSVTVTSAVAGSTAQPGVTFGYNAATGEQSSTTKIGTSNTVSTATDGWGRPTLYVNDAGEQTASTYDAAGYLKTVNNLTGTVSYSFDGTDANTKEEHRGLPTQVTVTRGGTSGLLTYTGAYNAVGQLEKQTMPGAMSQLSEYDRIGERTNLTYTGQVTPVTETTDPNTGETTWTPGQPLSNQPWLSWTRTYDALGRVAQEYNGAGAAFDGVPGVTDPTNIAAPSVGQAQAADKAYTYDHAGHLNKVTDRTAVETGDTLTPDTDPSSEVPCAVRTYSFDLNGNRTASGVLRDAGGDCSAATQTNARTYSYNAADQPIAAADSTAYSYDSLGRQTTLPAADAPNPSAGNVTLAYYDTDLIRSISQGSSSTVYSLDTMGRRTVSTTTTPSDTTSTIRHYVDGSDVPGWMTDATGVMTRYTPSLSGLGAAIGQDGSAVLEIADPHGDNVSTVTIPAANSESTPSVGIGQWRTFDEYGNSTTSASAGGLAYGYLGQQQREASPESAGLQLMGVRVYTPGRGLFTSSDPISGGNETAYGYPADPVNASDASGQWCWKCTLINGLAMGLQWALGRVACLGLTGLYLLCSGLVGGIVAMAKYLVTEVWAHGRKFTGHMLAVAAGLGVLGFMAGLFGGMVKIGDLLKKVKPLLFRLKPAIYQAARVAAQFFRDRGVYVLAQLMYQIPGAIIPRLEHG